MMDITIPRPAARPLLVLLALAATQACNAAPRIAEPAAGSLPARAFLVSGIDSLVASLSALDSALVELNETADTTRARASFRRARHDFKRIEGLLTYYIPVTTGTVNGPRLEADDDDPNPPVKSAPIGFQVIEAALFDGSISIDSAHTELRAMTRSVSTVLRSVASTNAIAPNAGLDAARLQLARVATLSIAGFDADVSGDAIVESASALEGVRDFLLVLLTDSTRRRAIDSTFTAAADDLRAHPDFASFDRLGFIVRSAVPAGRLLTDAQEELGNPTEGVRLFWRSERGSPYEQDAFSPDAFPPAHARPSTPELEEIGRRLFHEPALSGTGDRSCAFCHVPQRAFTDGRTRALPMPGAPETKLRNTPTLINVALQPAFFADDRALSLENQVGVVLASSAEMSSSADSAAARLERIVHYREAFRRAMPDRGDSAIGGLEVRQALSAYLRTLNALDSRFDRAVRGDTLALTRQERRGFDVFMGTGKCGTCHFAPLFNGLTPPFYRTSEAEIIGVPANADLDHPTLDSDVGRANVEDNPLNRFAFKVPSLRNVALTAPYMHNGVFRTLEEVVEFYDRGGGVGIGLTLPYQSLPTGKLGLSASDKKALVAFLGALTDTIPRPIRPVPSRDRVAVSAH